MVHQMFVNSAMRLSTVELAHAYQHCKPDRIATPICTSAVITKQEAEGSELQLGTANDGMAATALRSAPQLSRWTASQTGQPL